MSSLFFFLTLRLCHILAERLTKAFSPPHVTITSLFCTVTLNITQGKHLLSYKKQKRLLYMNSLTAFCV